MDRQNFAGAIVAIVFSTLAFIMSAYEVFAVTSAITHSAMSWSMVGFSFAAIVFSTYILASKKPIYPILCAICAIVVGVLAITAGVHFLLVCMIFAVLGATIQLA